MYIFTVINMNKKSRFFPQIELLCKFLIQIAMHENLNIYSVKSLLSCLVSRCLSRVRLRTLKRV